MHIASVFAQDIGERKGQMFRMKNYHEEEIFIHFSYNTWKKGEKGFPLALMCERKLFHACAIKETFEHKRRKKRGGERALLREE